MYKNEIKIEKPYGIMDIVEEILDLIDRINKDKV